MNKLHIDLFKATIRRKRKMRINIYQLNNIPNPVNNQRSEKKKK